MGKYSLILLYGGVALFVSGILAGIILYVNRLLTNTVSITVLCIIIIGIIISAIGLRLLDWKKILEEGTKKPKK
jgi:hypothetical protein